MSGTQRWFITGISSGIGAALAEAALRRGDIVIGSARADADVSRFNALVPGRSVGVKLDVSDIQDVRQVIGKILADGPLDIVVNNAGQSIYGAFEETSIPEAKALFDVNVFGPWAVTQAVLPHFREKRAGQLIYLSSGCGLNGMAGLSAYCASKFALEGLGEALACEVAQFDIKLLLVEPGAVATRFISHGTRETTQRMPEYEQLSGQGKAALESYYATSASSPESVAEAILLALDRPEQSLRLIVGEDMQQSVRAKAVHLAQLADSVGSTA